MSEIETRNLKKKDIPTQVTGFRVGENYYGISVLDVQEVVKPHSITPIPLVEEYIRGLINLRGQIVTSLSLRKLFQIEEDYGDNHMNVIIKKDDSLFSLVVDEILDVISVENEKFEQSQDIIDKNLQKYIKGVFVLKDKLLILLDLNKII